MSDWLSAGIYSMNTPKEKSGKRQFNHAYREELKLDTEPKNIIFVPGEYASYDHRVNVKLPYWEWERHTFKDGNRFRSFICSRGNDRSAECFACTRRYAKPKGDPRIGGARKKYFSVIHLDWYYHVQNEYGDSYFAQPRTQSQAREFEDQYERVFGALRYLPLGNAHAGQLFSLFEQVRDKCAGCLDNDLPRQGRLTPVGYVCGSCNAKVEDIETTELNRADFQALQYKKVRCPSCGHEGLPEPVLHCSNDCGSPTRSEIYDMVFPLVKQGSGKDTVVSIPYGESLTPIDDFSFDGQALFDDDGEMIPSIAKIYQPLDFHKVFEVEFTQEYQREIILGSVTADSDAPF